MGTAHLINVGAREEPADELSVDLRLLQLVDDVIQQDGRIRVRPHPPVSGIKAHQLRMHASLPRPHLWCYGAVHLRVRGEQAEI